MIVHGKGYSRSLHRALTEIAEYMDQHRDEVRLQHCETLGGKG